jgi:hypothetical protein
VKAFKLTGDKAFRASRDLIEVAPWHTEGSLKEMRDKLTPLGITVSVTRNKPKRTDEQNSFYWLCIGIVAKALGMSPDEAHEAVLCEYHGSNEVKIGSRVHHIPKGRSHDLPVEEMSELIETAYRVAAFCGVVLPSPESV